MTHTSLPPRVSHIDGPLSHRFSTVTPIDSAIPSGSPCHPHPASFHPPQRLPSFNPVISITITDCQKTVFPIYELFHVNPSGLTSHARILMITRTQFLGNFRCEFNVIGIIRQPFGVCLVSPLSTSTTRHDLLDRPRRRQ